jgi:hypothetical protein
MNPSLIRPGLLVSLRSNLRGGVVYQRRTIQHDTREGAAAIAEWETRREITDADEHARAVVARGAARTAITRVCCASTFGLLCPQSKEADLAAAIEEAQRIAAEFNATARCTRVDVFALVGRIASDDAEAARAIGSEVRELLDSMRAAVAAADVAAIRDAANKARAVSGMLSADVKGKVSAAIAEVRGIARDIVKRAEGVADAAAEIVRDVQMSKLDAARFAVLDLVSEEAPALAPSQVTAPAFDFDAAPDAPAPVAAVAPSLEFYC